MPAYVQVMTTVDSTEAARELARGIVQGRLAACVQVVGPIESFYRWRGEIESAQEWQLHAKTTAERLPTLQAHIKAQHTYDLPEIIVTPIDGSADYLNWISSETQPERAS